MSNHVPSAAEARTRAQRGQMLVVFAMAVVVIIGMVGIVIDISWYWTNSLRVQRAADAAALAGAVQLPTRPASAVADAVAQAAKNGYGGLTSACQSGGALAPTNTPGICARQNGTNRNQMDVALSAPVGTFFMRVFGIQTITASRTAKALYTLPVPMGSPENYYGVFGPVRDATMTTTTLVPQTTSNTVTGDRVTVGPKTPSALNPALPLVWTPSSGTINSAVATNEPSPPVVALTTGTSAQQWGGFGLLGDIPAGTGGNPSTSINIVGLQVVLNDARRSADNTCTANFRVRLNWNGGASGAWTSYVDTGSLPNSDPGSNFTLGAVSNTSAWGGHGWSRDELSDGNFRVQLTPVRGSNCSSSVNLQVDQIQVYAYYTVSTTTTTTTYVEVYNTSTPADYNLRGPGSACDNGAANCYKSTPAGGGQVLNARGFWATMNTEGAENINGDAYQPYYDDATSAPARTCPSGGNACYDPVNYYNYAVSMPPNTTGGRIFIFDPTFCATGTDSGTGDRWFSGSNSVSSWYHVYADPNNTPWDYSDDGAAIASSGSTFTGMNFSDSTMGGPSVGGSTGREQCRQWDRSYGDERDYHNSWYLLADNLTGGPNGTVYRVHTTQSGSVNQRSTNGEQSFAIFADNAEGLIASSRLPQVYGLGAMQMFTPLSSNGGTTSSEFYLAQVPEFYKGKILELNLWDPGDTGDLRADLYILRPTSLGWTEANFTYAAGVGTTGGANSACNSNANNNSSNNTVRTNAGGGATGNFNGCWLTLTVPIPSNYAGDQEGWWKIRYQMNGNSTSFDVTTWTATIKGNPVHLVVP